MSHPSTRPSRISPYRDRVKSHPPPALYEFATETGFNFTACMRAFCEALTRRLPAFEYVDPRRVLFTYNQCRTGNRHGIYAITQPFRFEDGAKETIHEGHRWLWPDIRVDGVTQLYQVTFYLPRFQNLPIREKLHTIVHELYHISPRFNGDLRRFAGRNFAHGHSRDAYDLALVPYVEAIAREYLSGESEGPATTKAHTLRSLASARSEAQAASLADFGWWLEASFRQLEQFFGGVCGLTVRGLTPRCLGAVR